MQNAGLCTSSARPTCTFTFWMMCWKQKAGMIIGPLSMPSATSTRAVTIFQSFTMVSHIQIILCKEQHAIEIIMTKHLLSHRRLTPIAPEAKPPQNRRFARRPYSNLPVSHRHTHLRSESGPHARSPPDIIWFMSGTHYVWHASKYKQTNHMRRHGTCF